MKTVWVVEEFDRADKYCEYGTGINIFSTKKKAKKLFKKAIENLREACLDTDIPEDEEALEDLLEEKGWEEDMGNGFYVIKNKNSDCFEAYYLHCYEVEVQ